MKEEQIRELCREYGLAIDRVRQADEVLVIVPQTLDDLPDQNKLSGLVATLRERTEKRYVTLAIDEID